MTAMARPLEGLKVLDLSRVLAGPYCGSLLGALGAVVTKVERPITGDENRSWGADWYGEGLHFVAVNSNKKGITIDFSKPSGKEIIRLLASESDVLIESFIPGTLDRIGLGHQDLCRLNPRLIYCSISGYGERGPLKQKPGYDGIIQAFGGHMAATGEPDSGPVRSGASVVDMSTGLAAFGAVMAALVGRNNSGKGQKVSVSLLQTSLALMGSHAVVSMMIGSEPQRAGSGVTHIVPYGAFRTKDGYISTGAPSQRAWSRLCSLIGRTDLVNDARFMTLPDRIENRFILNRTLDEAFSERTTDEWVSLFEKEEFVVSPVNSIGKAMSSPQVAANDMVAQTKHSVGHDLRLLTIPMVFEGWSNKTTAAPMLGEHTSEILQSLGYGDGDVEALRNEGAV